MKPFALTGVLQYKKQLEEVAVTKLVKAQTVRDGIQELYDSVSNEYEDLVSQLSKLQSTGIDVITLSRFEDRIFWIKSQLHEIKGRLIDADAKIKDERKNVLNKSSDKKILEQLKDRQDKAWRRYLDKKEIAQFDEMATLAHERKQHKH